MRGCAAAGGILALMLAGCATTGDPRQGGLFSWSETKAQGRQDERKRRLQAAENDRAREMSSGRQLEARGRAAEGEWAMRQTTEMHQQAAQREQAHVRARQEALVTRTEQLEAASTTPALASRARALRRRVNEAATQRSLSDTDRRVQFDNLEVEIEAASRLGGAAR